MDRHCKWQESKVVIMAKHSHRFVEMFDGFLGYGLDRESNENTVQVYLQKFSDDDLMETILKRMTAEDLFEVFDITSRMLKKYLTETEYHELFLKAETRDAGNDRL